MDQMRLVHFVMLYGLLGFQDLPVSFQYKLVTFQPNLLVIHLFDDVQILPLVQGKPLCTHQTFQSKMILLLYPLQLHSNQHKYQLEYQKHRVPSSRIYVQLEFQHHLMVHRDSRDCLIYLVNRNQ